MLFITSMNTVLWGIGFIFSIVALTLLSVRFYYELKIKEKNNIQIRINDSDKKITKDSDKLGSEQEEGGDIELFIRKDEEEALNDNENEISHADLYS